MAGTSAPDIPDCRDLSLVGERVARTIYTAHHARLERPVAITVYPPLTGPDDRERFDRSAAAAQRLGAHPSVLALHEWGVSADGSPWIATDTHVAEAADQLIRQHGPLDVAQALQIGVLLAGAVETAHRAGIVHGDIAPAQVVFGSNGEPLLAETGLTRFARLTGIGALMAPIRYHAPPEVLEGTATSPATDVYSLASTIYALLAGRAPHEKPANITDSNASLLLRILQLGVPPLDRPGTPAGLEEALRTAMAPQALHRPQQAIELAWALQDVQRRAGLGSTEPVMLDEGDLERLARTESPRTSAASVTRSSAGSAGPVTAPRVPDLWGGAGAPSAATAPGEADEAPIFPQLADAVPIEAPVVSPIAGPPDAVAPPGEAGGRAGESTAPDSRGGAPPTPGDRLDTTDAERRDEHPSDRRDDGPAPSRDTPGGSDVLAIATTAAPPAWSAAADTDAAAPAAPAGPLWQWSAPTTGPEPAPATGAPPGPSALPAWFTDPLPNQPGGHAGPPDADPSPPDRHASPAPDVGTPVPPGAPAQDAGWATSWSPQPTGPPPVWNRGEPAPGHRPGGDPAHGGGIDIGFRATYSWPGPEHDPLGPPASRPPLDTSRLAEPLGPAPLFPGVPAAPNAARPELPRRLPSPARSPRSPERATEAPTARTATAPAPLVRRTKNRTENRTAMRGAGGRRPASDRPTPTDPPAAPPAPPSVDPSPTRTGAFPGVVAGGTGRPGSALERARRARASRQQSGTATPHALPPGPSTGSTGDRYASARPPAGLPAGVTRRVTRAAPSTAGPAAGRVTSGPPALPVIVLVVVVVVLAFAAAWVIVSDDDAPPPARTDAPAEERAAGDEAGPGATGRAIVTTGMAGVTVTETAAGVRPDPDASPGAGYMVRVR